MVWASLGFSERFRVFVVADVLEAGFDEFADVFEGPGNFRFPIRHSLPVSEDVTWTALWAFRRLLARHFYE